MCCIFGGVLIPVLVYVSSLGQIQISHVDMAIKYWILNPGYILVTSNIYTFKIFIILWYWVEFSSKYTQSCLYSGCEHCKSTNYGDILSLHIVPILVQNSTVVYLICRRFPDILRNIKRCEKKMSVSVFCNYSETATGRCVTGES